LHAAWGTSAEGLVEAFVLTVFKVNDKTFDFGGKGEGEANLLQSLETMLRDLL
jgi:hypothetical protein